MPKKKAKKKLKKLNKKLIIFVLVPALLILGLLIVHVSADIKQKQLENKFSKLEQSMENLMIELSEKDASLAMDETKYCQRNQGKQEGRLYCAINLKLERSNKTTFYLVDNSISKGEFSPISVHEEEDPSGLFFRNNTYSYSGLDCYLREVQKSNGNELNLFCSKEVNKSFYPYRSI